MELEATRLAHKRALDRKSQNAKRERARLKLQSLEEQLKLSEERCGELERENERLEVEVYRLRNSLTLPPIQTPMLTISCSDIDGGIDH